MDYFVTRVTPRTRPHCLISGKERFNFHNFFPSARSFERMCASVWLCASLARQSKLSRTMFAVLLLYNVQTAVCFSFGCASEMLNAQCQTRKTECNERNQNDVVSNQRRRIDAAAIRRATENLRPLKERKCNKILNENEKCTLETGNNAFD